jgi:hypothetical protein
MAFWICRNAGGYELCSLSSLEANSRKFNEPKFKVLQRNVGLPIEVRDTVLTTIVRGTPKRVDLKFVTINEFERTDFGSYFAFVPDELKKIILCYLDFIDVISIHID